jgi:hypothetical protein
MNKQYDLDRLMEFRDERDSKNDDVDYEANRLIDLWRERALEAEDALSALEEKLANTERRYAELVETVSRRTSQAAINAAKEALQ